jgi:hypothetical protein
LNQPVFTVSRGKNSRSVSVGLGGLQSCLESGHAGCAAGLFPALGRGFGGLSVARHYDYGFSTEAQVAEIPQAELHNCRNRSVVAGGKDAGIAIDGLVDGSGSVSDKGL